jgi:hypothetical protein
VTAYCAEARLGIKPTRMKSEARKVMMRPVRFGTTIKCVLLFAECGSIGSILPERGGGEIGLSTRHNEQRHSASVGRTQLSKYCLQFVKS